MTYYSKYRRQSYDWKPIICAIVVALCFGLANEMDYREQVNQEVCK